MPHLPSSPSGRGHLAALSGSGSAPVHREGTSQLLVHFKCRDIDQLLTFPQLYSHGHASVSSNNFNFIIKRRWYKSSTPNDIAVAWQKGWSHYAFLRILSVVKRSTAEIQHSQTVKSLSAMWSSGQAVKMTVKISRFRFLDPVTMVSMGSLVPRPPHPAFVHAFRTASDKSWAWRPGNKASQWVVSPPCREWGCGITSQTQIICPCSVHV